MAKVNELVVSLGLNTTTFHSKIKEVNQTLKLFKSEFEKAGAGVKDFEKTQEGLKAKFESLNKQIEVTQAKIKAYKEEIEKTKQKLKEKQDILQDTTKRYQEQKNKVEELTKLYGENSKEVQEAKKQLTKLEVELTQNEKTVGNTANTLKRYQTELNNTESDLKKLEKQLEDTNKKMGSSLTFENAGTKLANFGKITNDIGKTITSLGTAIAPVSLAMSGLGGFAIKTSIDFEAAMSKLKALSGAGAKDMQALTDKAREMGKATSFSATEAAEGLQYMALAGWDTNEMLTGIEPVLRLAEAGNLELGRASDLATDSLSSMGKSVDELQGYLDIVAKTSTVANTDIDQLMQAFLEVGQTADTLGIDTIDLAANLSTLADAGKKGGEAGHSLQTILSRLSAPTAAISTALDELGVQVFDSDGKFRGLTTVLQDFDRAMSGLSEEQQLYYSTIIAGKNHLTNFQTLVKNVGTKTADYTKQIKDSDNALFEMAKTMKDNVQGQLERLKSAIEELGLSFGETI